MFKSYTAHCEDAILWSLLGKLPQGFFLTVEAEPPLQSAMTQGFYAYGWRGLNVIANPKGHEILLALRPDDRHLYARVAASDESLVQQADPVVLTLEAICRYYAPPVFELLHLGSTLDKATVIRSLQWQDYRPRVVLVSVGTAEELEWEKLLIQQDYHFIRLLGYQRVYLAAEQMPLATEWLANPSCWDEPCVWHKEADLTALARDLDACRCELILKEQQYQVLRVEHSRVLNELHAVYASKAWRITQPLRWLSHYGKIVWRRLRRITAP